MTQRVTNILDDSRRKADPKKGFTGKQDWRTPPWLCEQVNQYRRVDFDPCTDTSNPLGARVAFCPPQDALELSWCIEPGWHCWMNPPYSRSVGLWIDKMLGELAGVPGAEATLLVRLDCTKWFSRLMDEATAIVIPHRRIKYVDPATNMEVGGTNFASALVNVGGNHRHFCHHWERIAQLGAALQR